MLRAAAATSTPTTSASRSRYSSTSAIFEAHLIRAQSVNRYTPKAIREVARPQIEELLDDGGPLGWEDESTFAVDVVDSPGGFGQVGCVYTAQGFEYHWNGVIFGPDLVWRTDRWVSRREFNKDPDFKSAKTVSDATFDRLVRHVYKVLLTRGLTGTLLYSVDAETQAMLRRVVNPH